MKKILIFSHAMEIGGAEKALLGLLETIDTTKYSVDLFLMRHTGELMKYIPEEINLLPEIPQYSALAIPIIEVLKKGQFSVAFGRCIGKEKAKQTVKRLNLSKDNQVGLEYSHKYTLKYMPSINAKEYDLAISFLTPHYFVAERVRAKKKIAWIHTDYSAVKVDKESEIKMWSKYDKIISISDDVTTSFLRTFPQFSSKIEVIENIMPIKSIYKMTDEFSVESEMPSDGSVKILSVGRFSYAKRFDEVPDICRKIRQLGTDVKWYLIGFGGDEKLIRQKIIEAGVQNYVVILGKKENPYPYIKACDLYVQPSRYEGKSVAVREAQLLGKPVVITNYSTAQSQVKDGFDGVIAPMDIQKCAEKIVSVIRDKSLQNRLIEKMKNEDYVKANKINLIYSIIDD